MFTFSKPFHAIERYMHDITYIFVLPDFLYSFASAISVGTLMSVVMSPCILGLITLVRTLPTNSFHCTLHTAYY